MRWKPAADGCLFDERFRRADDDVVVRRGPGWLLAATLVLMLSACSSTGTTTGVGGSSGTLETASAAIDTSPVPPASTTTPSTTVPSAEQPASSATAQAPSTSADILVEYSRQGGIRGISDHLTVLEDGAVTVTRNRPAATQSGQLSPAELTDLRQLLDALNSTPPSRPDPVKGNDLYSYQVIYRGTEILAEQGAVPPALEPVLAQLAGIVAAYGA
jgi:hypothetical protein